MFLTKADLFSHIDEKLVNQLSRNNDDTINDILLTAEATVRESLMQLYDVDAIFSTTGTARPKRVIWWACCIACWMLYKKAQVNTPEHIKTDYQDCLLTLERICDAKQPADLPRKSLVSGEPKTKFRWSSQPKRTH